MGHWDGSVSGNPRAPERPCWATSASNSSSSSSRAAAASAIDVFGVRAVAAAPGELMGAMPIDAAKACPAIAPSSSPSQPRPRAEMTETLYGEVCLYSWPSSSDRDSLSADLPFTLSTTSSIRASPLLAQAPPGVRPSTRMPSRPPMAANVAPRMAPGLMRRVRTSVSSSSSRRFFCFASSFPGSGWPKMWAVLA